MCDDGCLFVGGCGGFCIGCVGDVVECIDVGKLFVL